MADLDTAALRALLKAYEALSGNPSSESVRALGRLSAAAVDALPDLLDAADERDRLRAATAHGHLFTAEQIAEMTDVTGLRSALIAAQARQRDAEAMLESALYSDADQRIVWTLRDIQDDRDQARAERDRLQAAGAAAIRAEPQAVHDVEGERDRVRDAAAALEAENAQLREQVVAVADWFADIGRPLTGADAAFMAEGCRRVLAATDPLRAEM